MVVVGIISFVAVIGFYGIQSNRDATNLNNAKNEFLNNLRAAHNRAVSGEGGGDQLINITSSTAYSLASRAYKPAAGACSSGWTVLASCTADWECCSGGGACCYRDTDLGSVSLPAGVTISPSSTGIAFARTPNTNKFRVDNLLPGSLDIVFTGTGGLKTIRISGNSGALRIYEP